MTVFDFNDRGRAYVEQFDFEEYVMKDKVEGDYVRENDMYWCYYNSAGCMLARYDKTEGYGQLI